MQNISNNQGSLPSINRRVGRFLLTEKLGDGASGAVFRGHDPVIDRDVAIKILNTDAVGNEKKQREQQFINEARAAGRLSHPGIVTIYDTATENGVSFIAMEYLAGKDLRSMLAEGKQFDIIETARIIQKIAAALAYAHQHGVIHRDIKPGNIFILPDQHAKVVDFGIARAPNRVNREGITTSGATLFQNNLIGTPNYMSPEQASGKTVSNLTDIYSLGAVMYEMLTGQKPFQAADNDKLLQLICSRSPKPPADIRPGIPTKLSRIVMKAMEKAPELRYQTATEMEQALQKFLERDKKLKRRRLSGHPDQAGEQSVVNRSIPWLSLVALALAILVLSLGFMRHG